MRKLVPESSFHEVLICYGYDGSDPDFFRAKIQIVDFRLLDFSPS